jgi:hypothetical protein
MDPEILLPYSQKPVMSQLNSYCTFTSYSSHIHFNSNLPSMPRSRKLSFPLCVMTHQSRFNHPVNSTKCWRGPHVAYLTGGVMAADNALRELAPRLVWSWLREVPGVSAYPTPAMVLLPLHCLHTTRDQPPKRPHSRI